MGAAKDTNPFLAGNFAPVSEEVTVADLEVTGKLPDQLDGRYVRIGPNPLRTVDAASYHWFLGVGMTHGVRLRGGHAEWYRNRWVRSAEVAQSLGEPTRPGPVHAGFDFAANTNVIYHAGRTLALVEGGPLPYELDEKLGTVGPCDFDGTLPGGYTAHPHNDPATGELHAISYFWAWGSRVRYTVTGADGRVRKSLDIELETSPMMHDFSLTEHHVIVYDLPVIFDAKKAVNGAAPMMLAKPLSTLLARLLRGRGLPEPVVSHMPKRNAYGGLPYSWDPERPGRIGILPREGAASDIRWYEVNPCYVFHPMGAFEDGERIVCELVRHPKMFDAEHRGPNEGPPTLDRWTIDPAAGKVVEERLDDQPQEFPRIDERLMGRRHRIGYSVTLPAGPDPGMGDSVLRHDLAGATTSARCFGQGKAVSEFVFVGSETSRSEEDGFLMGYVHDLAEGTAELAVLDATTLEDVARVHIPVRIPFGFHGNWLPSAAPAHS
jgi:carotenoid cleavage dioxygenase